MNRERYAALLSLSLVTGMSLPAMAAPPPLPFTDVDMALLASISGNTASVSEVTNLTGAAESSWDDVDEGWYACDTAIPGRTSNNTINSLDIQSGVLVEFNITPGGGSALACRSLNESSSSIVLSTATIWSGVQFVSYSDQSAAYPHIGYFGAYVVRTESPTTNNVRIMAPGTVQYTPAAEESEPTLSRNGAFTLNGSFLSVTSPFQWAGSPTTAQRIAACTSAIPSNFTPTTSYSTFSGSCSTIVDATSNANGATSPVDLTSIKVLTSWDISGPTMTYTYEPYDPDVHGTNIAYQTFATVGVDTYGVTTASQVFGSSPSPAEPAAVPYTGPVVQAPGISAPRLAGEKLTLTGSNLSDVSKAEIAGLDCQVVVNSAGEIEIVVPAGLASGTYDLVITSDSGKLTIQDAIVVSGSTAITSTGEARPSTKRMPDDTAKVWIFDVAGAGKVQILVNGREIAWVRTDDANDAKLTNGYLVRTVDLAAGKNVIEVLVDGEQVRRTVYSN